MEVIRVLLVCGGGASSGFLSSSMKKAAKKKGLMMDIKARSETDIEDLKNNIDILLAAPHLKYMEAEIQKALAGTDVPLEFIDEYVYGTLDGEKAIETVMSLLEKRS